MSNIIAVLVGLGLGILANYLADILPVRRRLSHPLCLNCGQPQPLVNYLLWPRRCTNCQQRRPIRTWVVEAVSIGMALWLWNSPEVQQRLGVVLGGIVLTYFAVIFIIDYEHRLILHTTSLFGMALGFFVGIKLNGWLNTLLGGAVGYGIMFGLFYLGFLFTKWMARVKGRAIDEVALGFGDVNLTGELGLMLGWPNVVIALFLSVLSAGLVGGGLLLAKIFSRKYRSFMLAMPYGPFLLLGAFLMLFLPIFTQELLKLVSPLF